MSRLTADEVRLIRTSPEEERRLIRAAKAGDVEAADALLRAHEPFIKEQASKRHNLGERADLEQAGLEALLAAIKSFDLDRDEGLLTYAGTAIVGAMHAAAADKGLGISPSSHKRFLAAQRHSDDPEEARRYAVERGMGADTYGSLREVLADQPEFDEEGMALTVVDTSINPSREERALRLAHRLSPRRRQVIEMTYGLGEGYAREDDDEIARELGITSGRVGNIRREAMKQLQKWAAAESEADEASIQVHNPGTGEEERQRPASLRRRFASALTAELRALEYGGVAEGRVWTCDDPDGIARYCEDQESSKAAHLAAWERVTRRTSAPY